MRPLALTIGDAAGIGPEVLLAALAGIDPAQTPIVVYGVRHLLDLSWDALHSLRADLLPPSALRPITRDELAHPPAIPPAAHALVDVSDDLPEPARRAIEALDAIPFGQPFAAFGHLQGVALEAAIDDALAGHVSGICTAPLTKSLFLLAGRPPTGHTEILAERTVAPHHVMMLAGDRLRVALVTTHLPLGAVPAALTTEAIVATIGTTAHDLAHRFGVAAPRIAVAALNPHAGESGTMGLEERDLIAPAIARAIELGYDVHGPFPADTLFAPLGRPDRPWPWDAVVCMYHDQALIPLKLVHFGQSANITLGLPIVRTSVDHGTAWDIAGLGKADHASMAWAIHAAVRLLPPDP